MKMTNLFTVCPPPLHSGAEAGQAAQGQEGNERVMASPSFLWTYAQGMQQPRAHSWKQSAC